MSGPTSTPFRAPGTCLEPLAPLPEPQPCVWTHQRPFSSPRYASLLGYGLAYWVPGTPSTCPPMSHKRDQHDSCQTTPPRVSTPYRLLRPTTTMSTSISTNTNIGTSISTSTSNGTSGSNWGLRRTSRAWVCFLFFDIYFTLLMYQDYDMCIDNNNNLNSEQR